MQRGLAEVFVGLSVVAEEAGRGGWVGSEDGAADEVGDAGSGRGVNGVFVPGPFVVRGRTQQEHLVGTGHGRIRVSGLARSPGTASGVLVSPSGGPPARARKPWARPLGGV